MNAMNVPVTITPEAAQRIAQLNFEKQVEQMLEYGRSHLPGLVRFQIELNIRYEEPDSEDGVYIEAWCNRPYDQKDRTRQDLITWMITTFPPEVLEHLHMSHYLEGEG
jgi:hypothetical protein